MDAKQEPSNIDNDSPSEWVDQYGDALYRFALSRVSDPDLAADLVQDTLLAALEAKNSFKGRSTRKTWLMAILKHKIIDSFRRKSRQKSVTILSDFAQDIDSAFNANGQWQMPPGIWARKPDDIYNDKEFLKILYVCLSLLSERQSLAFILREIDGLGTEEICKQLEITATNNWVLLHRARMNLRTCIEEKWLSKPGDKDDA